ncbi:MAG: hypothetical protein LBJ35_03080 [Spirochaetaceae bacterium]|nr:hypothetical protein [Spirochaetaceae bacterium]
MKRIVFVIGVAAIVTHGAYSYDAPPYGENMLLLGFPGFISNAASTVGGGLYDAGPYSININPALTAPLQRVSADIGGTILIKEGSTGFAFLLGMLFPSRWGVWTALAQGAFISPPLSPAGNTYSGRFGWSRDITDNLYLGASVFAGVTTDYGVGYAAGLDLGFVYRMGNLGFLKDARLSAAVANIGKTFDNDIYKNFPGAFAPKGGFAAVLFENNSFEAGFSVDVSFPTFQNLVINAGVELGIVKMITVSFGWDANLRELADRGENMHSPFVAVGFKWTADTGASEILKSQGWEKTDVGVSALYQQINDSAHLFSAGVSAQFGSIDKDPPVIKLGESES